jgi:ABC-2 type transport system ATP-binding protein
VLALLNDPELVFLDKLTTGLDPQARRQTWDLVRDIRAQGKTAVLVTHFMEEAQTLCDHVAIVDGGQIVALDTPDGLLTHIDRERGVVFDHQPELALASLEALPAVERATLEHGSVKVFGSADNLVLSVVLALEAQGLPIRNFRTAQPDLDDVFLALTGKALRD